MNNELFRRDVDCQRVGNPGSSDCSGDLLFRSLAAQKSSVFRKVLRAESGRGGGMLVALVLSCLEYFHFMKVNFDTLLQTLLMLAFFTTIGLSASLKIVTEGGKLLVS